MDDEELTAHMNALDKGDLSQANFELPPLENNDDVGNAKILAVLQDKTRAFMADDREDRPMNIVEKLAARRVEDRDGEDGDEEAAGEPHFTFTNDDEK